MVIQVSDAAHKNKSFCRDVRIIRWISLAVGLVILAGGCRPDRPRTLAKQVGFMAVVGAGQADPLWPVIRGSAERFVRTLAVGLDLRVRIQAPETVSPDQQAQLIRRLHDQGMRGLCVQIGQPPIPARLLESLRSEGVVVVTMMRQVKSKQPFLHSGINPYDLGAALAQAVAQQVPQRGTLGLLYADKDDVDRRRLAGFRSRIPRFPRLSVLRELDCAGEPATAGRMIRQTMERFPGIDGWVSLGSWPLRIEGDGQPLLPEQCPLVVPGPASDFAEQLTRGHCRTIVMADYHVAVSRALHMCLLSLQREVVDLRLYEAPFKPVTLETLPQFQRDWKAWTAVSRKPVGEGS